MNPNLHQTRVLLASALLGVCGEARAHQSPAEALRLEIKNPFMHCFAEEARSGTRRVNVVYHFKVAINPDGTIDHTDVVASRRRYPELEACLVEAIARVDTLAPMASATTVEFTHAFGTPTYSSTNEMLQLHVRAQERRAERECATHARSGTETTALFLFVSDGVLVTHDWRARHPEAISNVASIMPSRAGRSAATAISTEWSSSSDAGAPG